MSGITFDAGGLIALDRNDRRILAFLHVQRKLEVASRFLRLRSRRRSVNLLDKHACQG
jgi:hypothetical protein